MVKVRLPDGRQGEFAGGSTIAEALRAIDPRIGREAVAAELDGRIVDLATRLSGDTVTVRPLTMQDAEGLNVARHSCAHVMAEAICTLWPQTRLVYGPPVEDGFYYDIDLDHRLTPDDFARIEAKMNEIVKEDRPFTRYDIPRSEAMQKLSAEGNPYKIDNAERAEGETLSFYVSGTRDSGCFEDLCRGPHVPSTGRVGAFKVMQVAGAYWHGDASKQMLQRVYGTSWPKKKDLDAYVQRLEEAKKRDHRRIGQELGLFTIDPLVGSGLILWKPRGAIVRAQLEAFIREELLRRGYQPVITPHIGRLELYRTSGHFPYYREAQFPPLYETDTARILNELWVAAYERPRGECATERERQLIQELVAADPRTAGLLVGDAESQHRKYQLGADPQQQNLAILREHLQHSDGFLLKPMNCPHHMRIYGSEPRSYRELPIRLSEFGTVYRYEQSGELNGMTRVRGFTQDDAHIFCMPEQLGAEMADCVDFTRKVLETLGLHDYRVRIGLRDPKSDKYVGEPDVWDKAEQAVRNAAIAAGLRYSEEPGEAAFYGPKIDFVVRDCIGREWQLGTVQVDYNLPARFNLKYIGDDNQEHRPVMVHRAPLGSFERFCGILIEHFVGAFPTWLAPVQAILCTVSDKSAEYGREVFTLCQKAGLRIEMNTSGERIGAKIRDAAMMKIPYILVVGEQEAAGGLVNVRTRDGRQLGSCTVPEFLASVAVEIATRAVSGRTEPISQSGNG